MTNIVKQSNQNIVDETVQPSPMKMRTRSKARRTLLIPDPDICSDVEEDEPVNTKEVNTKQQKPRQPRQPRQKQKKEVIDLDM